MTDFRFPIQEYLVKGAGETELDDWNVIDRTLDQGIPHKINLEADLSIVVILPNGSATFWRDSSPTTLVSESSGERQPMNESQAAVWTLQPEPAPRLIVRRAQRTYASLALRADLQVIVAVSEKGKSGQLLDLRILDWKLHSGTIRGTGDFRSRIRLAWRRIDKGAEHYSVPPVNPYSLPRLEIKYRMFSVLGLKKVVKLSRFSKRQYKIKEMQ